MCKRMATYVFIAVLMASVPLSEATAAPYYQGKTIRVIVGFGPGGGYDRIARLLARHLPKYIPGKPTVIVENMPGGATIIAANYVYNIAKPDGLTIGALGRGLPLGQLMKTEGIKFDMAKFTWVGSAAVEATVLAVRGALPYKTFNDLRKAPGPIMMGQTGPAESSSQFAILIKEFLGVNLKMVNYPSGNDINLGVERNEVDGRAASYSGIKLMVERGSLRPLIRGGVAEPGVENLPVDEQLCTDPIGKTIMTLRSAPEKMGRPYVLPPKTPPEAAEILRTAFAKVADDPAVKEDSKKMMMQVQYVSANECLKISKFILGQPDKVVREVSKYLIP